MKRNHSRWIGIVSTLAFLERAQAVEFEPLGKAIGALLGTTQAKKRDFPIPAHGNIPAHNSTVFYTKDASGKLGRAVFVEKGIYEPSCTHTWAIGIDPARGTVTDIRVVEMSCPHAFPTRAANYLNQYKGKGPADAATLSSKVDVIANASSRLT